MALLILLKPRGAEEEAARGCGSYIVLELTVGVDEEEGRIADHTVFLKKFEVVVEMEPGPVVTVAVLRVFEEVVHFLELTVADDGDELHIVVVSHDRVVEMSEGVDFADRVRVPDAHEGEVDPLAEEVVKVDELLIDVGERERGEFGAFLLLTERGHELLGEVLVLDEAGTVAKELNHASHLVRVVIAVVVVGFLEGLKCGEFANLLVAEERIHAEGIQESVDLEVVHPSGDADERDVFRAFGDTVGVEGEEETHIVGVVVEDRLSSYVFVDKFLAALEVHLVSHLGKATIYVASEVIVVFELGSEEVTDERVELVETGALRFEALIEAGAVVDNILAYKLVELRDGEVELIVREVEELKWEDLRREEDIALLVQVPVEAGDIHLIGPSGFHIERLAIVLNLEEH